MVQDVVLAQNIAFCTNFAEFCFCANYFAQNCAILFKIGQNLLRMMRNIAQNLLRMMQNIAQNLFHSIRK